MRQNANTAKPEWATLQDAGPLRDLGVRYEAAGDLENAASAYDKAYSLSPDDDRIASDRKRVLSALQVEEHGFIFRYVPAGTFLMGSEEGDPDEAPIHEVHLDAYWLSDTPVSWTDYCRLMNWNPPPNGMPKIKEEEKPDFYIANMNKIRLQYCENHTLRARDWHRHMPRESMNEKAQEIFPKPERSVDDVAYSYSRKPMVAIGWKGAQELGKTLSSEEWQYTLPTEAEWEKGARGGLVGCRYPWGNDEPTQDNCDFDHFNDFAIQPMKSFVPNGYGLFAMSGGVWEWTEDWYDERGYSTDKGDNPTGPENGQEKVLRGGAWSDCAGSVTVSFRMSRQILTGRANWQYSAANIGFRLCRKPKGS